jgi:hypothetical protein
MAELPTVLERFVVRLRGEGPGSAAKLASLLVDGVLGKPLGEVIDSAFLAHAVRDVFVALTASDAATQRIVDRVGRAASRLSADRRAFGAVVPGSIAEGARDLARLPATPSREALTKLLDREPVRRLLRLQMIDALAAFGRRAASPVAESSLARGIGGISKLALAPLGSRPSPLARVASAVSGEVERQVERRATEFADTAVAGILAGIIEQVSDPARQDEQAAFRASLVDGLLELTGVDVAEVVRGQTRERVEVLRAAFASWSTDPDFVADLQSIVDRLMAEDAARPLGDLLEELGIRAVVATHATASVERAVMDLIATPAFEQWLEQLLTP